ncbi:MAG: CPBP family glutamic-type intramembrane protease [Terriglobia bacterium]
MKRLAIGIIALALLAVVAEGALRLEMPLRQPGQFYAVFLALALTLGLFVALTDSRVIKWLRRRVVRSASAAAALPLLLLIPYFIEAVGTGTLSGKAISKLLAYILIPSLLLLPDRLGTAGRVGWRDFLAMLALAVPVGAGWLGGIWTGFGGVPFFRPLYSVCAGGYAFLAIRNLHDVGYRLTWRKQDFIQGVAHYVGFAIIAIPLGYALHFIRFHSGPASLKNFVIQFVGIYVMIAIPEEFFFRGVLQNFLEKSFSGERRGLYALLIASVVFGASHLQHAPAPNWRYGILATIAGLFYGSAYRDRRRLSASALTHTLVDFTRHFWL